MKKEVDFIAEFEKEEAELNREKTNPCPPTEEQYQKMKLGIKLVELKQSQYQKRKNEKLWDLWTNTFTPLCVTPPAYREDVSPLRLTKKI